MSTGTALMSIIAAGAPFLAAVAVQFAVLIGGTVAAVLIALWTGEHAGITRRALRHMRRVRLATAVADVDERHWRSVQDMLAGCGWCADDGPDDVTFHDCKCPGDCGQMWCAMKADPDYPHEVLR